MRKTFTDKVVKAKNPGAPIIWDELTTGLGMRVGSTKRTFFVQTRVNGKEIKRSLGKARMDDRDTSALSVAQAREKAGEVIIAAQNGIDLKERQATEKAAVEVEKKRAEEGSFGAVALRYAEAPNKKRGGEKRTRSQIERMINVEIPADWHDRPIGSITRAEVRALHEKKAKKAPPAANRLLSMIRTIFNYAIKQDLVDTNPAALIDPVGEEKRDRILDDHEIRAFWRGLDADEVKIDRGLLLCLKFILATGARRSEALLATWDEFDFTPGKQVWRIPAERSKNGYATEVPLSPAALDLIDEVALLAPRGAEHVFTNRWGRPYAVYSLSQAMRKCRPVCGLEDNRATPHDLRRSFASNIAKLGFSREVLKRLLNHREGDVTDIYDRHRYDEEARLAMNAWSDKLGEIVSGKPAPDNVVRIA